MQKSLTSLSEEYFAAAENLDKTIAKYRKQLKDAYIAKNYLKTYEIKRKLTILYDQKHDTISTAHLLKNYYNDTKEIKSA